MVIDFYDLEKLVNENIIDKLDHTFLNEKIKNPTTENIASWIWQFMEKSLRIYDCDLYQMELWENSDSSIIIRK